MGAEPKQKMLSIGGRARPYVWRMLTLTLLAPDIMEAILGGRQPKGTKLAEVLRRIEPAWSEQRSLIYTGVAEREPSNRGL